MPPNKGKFIKIIVTLVYGQFGQTLYQNMPKYFKFLRRKKNNKNNLFRHFSLRGGFYSEDPHELLLVSFFFSILTIWTFMPLFSSGQNLKKTLKKKEFWKIKGVRGNSEVSTIDKSVFAPFFCLLTSFDCFYHKMFRMIRYNFQNIFF